MTRKSPPLTRRLHGMMFKLPLMISCNEFEEFIVAYLDGELSRKKVFLFELHLKVCRECRDYLRAYKSSMNLTKSALAKQQAELEDVPADLVTAVLAARDV